MSEASRAKIVEALKQMSAKTGDKPAETSDGKYAQIEFEFQPPDTLKIPPRTEESQTETEPKRMGRKYTAEELAQARADALAENMPIQDIPEIRRIKEIDRRRPVRKNRGWVRHFKK